MGCCGSGGVNGQYELDWIDADDFFEGNVEGLTPAQLERLAKKVYDLLRRESRLESDRGGSNRRR